MSYIKLPKSIIPCIKENKYSAMVYGYVSARRGYDGICYFSINLLSHTLKHNVVRDRTKGICFNFWERATCSSKGSGSY